MNYKTYIKMNTNQFYQRAKYPLILLSVGVISAVGSYIGSNFRLEERVSELVAVSYDAEVRKLKVELNILSDGMSFEPDTSPASKERFVPDNADGLSRLEAYLLSKVGFKFPYSEKKELDASEYIYKIQKGIHGTPVEGYLSIDNMLLVSSNWSSGRTKSFIQLYDSDNDNIPDRIRITDEVSNKGIAIRRNEDGILEYEDIDEAGAKKLFSFYTRVYQGFKVRHKIDELVRAFVPELEINQVDISIDTSSSKWHKIIPK